MMKHLFIALLFATPVGLIAQATTTYLDSHGRETTRGNHKTFKSEEWRGEFLHSVHYNKDGQMISEGLYIDSAAYKAHGAELHYFDNGQLKSRWVYDHGIPRDSATGYFESGELYYVKTFEDGKTNYEQYFDRNGNEVETESMHREPEFPGGQNELFQYLMKNTKYPKAARDAGVSGVSYIEFIVDADGTVKDVMVLRSSDPMLDEEAMRIVRSFPKWTPGIEYGEAQDVVYRLPFRFNLQ